MSQSLKPPRCRSECQRHLDFRGTGGQICPLYLLWLLAFTTSCTTVQAVILYLLHVATFGVRTFGLRGQGVGWGHDSLLLPLGAETPSYTLLVRHVT